MKATLPSPQIDNDRPRSGSDKADNGTVTLNYSELLVNTITDRDLLYVSGCISDNQTDFLIDSGASANFISSKSVLAFGLTVKQCPSSDKVKLPDGTFIEANNYISEPISLAGVELPATKFFVLDIEPAVVLGLAFLK